MPTIAVTVVTVDPRPTAVIAQTTSWEEFPTLWPRLLDEVNKVVRRNEDLDNEGTTEIWHNVMLYKDDKPSVEVGVLAVRPFKPEDRVIASHLPGGTTAMAIHRGDYALLGATHAAVLDYVKAHGFGLAGPRVGDLRSLASGPGRAPDRNPLPGVRARMRRGVDVEDRVS